VTDDDRGLDLEIDAPLGRAEVEAFRLEVFRLAHRYGAEVRSFRIERVDPIEGG